MQVPTKIQLAADRLKAGHRVKRITVRDFLRHFGTERRGAVKVEAIRRILDSLELQTEPDFDAVWIDSPIWLRLKSGVQIPTSPSDSVSSEAEDDPAETDAVLDTTPSSVENAQEQANSAPIAAQAETSNVSEAPTTAPAEDPTFRIGSLPAANKRLIVVNQSDSLSKAVTLMMQYDFAQLPVMHGEREVKGVVTWQSIATRKALDCKCELVGDCREEARIVDSNRTLFDAIPVIVEYGYVLVRNETDRRITGIVTASDLSLQFQLLAQPFLLLREVELHVRQLLGSNVSSADLEALEVNFASPHKIQNISDLTFGQYVRLFQTHEVWVKLGLKIDRAVFIELLESVRVIRNDVMHFDPDPMTAEDLAALKRASNLLQNLYHLLP